MKCIKERIKKFFRVNSKSNISNVTSNDKTLYCFYDLDLHPISFDIAYFLVASEIERITHSLDKIHVCIVPMKNAAERPVPSDYNLVVDLDSRMWRVENILLQVPHLIQSVKGLTIFGSKDEALIFRGFCRNVYPAPINKLQNREPHHVDFFNKILETPSKFFIENKGWGFRASKQAKKYVKEWLKDRIDGKLPVVITLRQYQVDPQRNSDENAWCEFADYLIKKNYAPIFIPDTDLASEIPKTKYKNYFVYEAASWSIGLRMAIYEIAYLNMFVNTGPNSLAVLSDNCRYLFFKIIVDDVALTSVNFLEWLGFKIGEQPTFCSEFQKWVWNGYDSFDKLVNEFEKMELKIKFRKA